MIRVVSAVVCILVAIIAPRASFADEPVAPASPPSPAADPVPAPAPVPPPVTSEQPLPQPQRARDITIEVPGERSRNTKLVLGGVAAAGVIASVLGVYWHLDSRDASNEVSADEFTGEAWSEDKIAIVDRADRSRTRAIVAYSIGGALLIGTITAWIITAPKSETAVIHTGRVTITPTEHGDGGMISRMWSF